MKNKASLSNKLRADLPLQSSYSCFAVGLGLFTFYGLQIAEIVVGINNIVTRGVSVFSQPVHYVVVVLVDLTGGWAGIVADVVFGLF